jgi:hypothetical protein
MSDAERIAELEAEVARLSAKVAWLTRPLSPARKAAIAEIHHTGWLLRLKTAGVVSRLAYWNEEELLVPWGHLSEEAREYNLDSVEKHEAAWELTDTIK